MPDSSDYEVAVIGGGPGGLTTALYTTRLGHDTVLIDRGGGRAAMMVDTHNVIGVTEDISGIEFLEIAQNQIAEHGADVYKDFVSAIDQRDDGRFRLTTTDGTFVADRVVLATGFADVRPEPPLPRTGRGLHYCLHCDAYMFIDNPVYVMGSGESAAHVAMIMLNFTDEVDILLRDQEPTWSPETEEQLRAHPVTVIEAAVTAINNGDDGWLESLEFADGAVREYRGGFAVYGSDYNNDLATQLGCDCNEDGTVAVDDHGRTSVEGVYAIGDLTPGHNQIPVAMGEGAKTGIAIHTELREFPKPLDALNDGSDVDDQNVPAISQALRDAKARRARGDD